MARVTVLQVARYFGVVHCVSGKGRTCASKGVSTEWRLTGGSSGPLASGACQCTSAYGLGRPLMHNVRLHTNRRHTWLSDSRFLHLSRHRWHLFPQLRCLKPVAVPTLSATRHAATTTATQREGLETLSATRPGATIVEILLAALRIPLVIVPTGMIVETRRAVAETPLEMRRGVMTAAIRPAAPRILSGTVLTGMIEGTPPDARPIRSATLLVSDSFGRSNVATGCRRRA
jgi:hypothetical protein